MRGNRRRAVRARNEFSRGPRGVNLTPFRTPTGEIEVARDGRLISSFGGHQAAVGKKPRAPEISPSVFSREAKSLRMRSAFWLFDRERMRLLDFGVFFLAAFCVALTRLNVELVVLMKRHRLFSHFYSSCHVVIR